MSSGGYRTTSGRKHLVNHAESRRIIQQASDEGILPLQVMFDNIRFYTKQANELIAQLLSGVMPETAADTDSGPQGTIIEAIGQVVGLRKLAGEEAARAAPYCHPRQGNAADDAGEGEQEVPLHARLAAYQRRDDLAAAGSNSAAMISPPPAAT